MIQPAGLGGSPAEGHRCTAEANASWTASSAMSMSPKARIKTATARPCSSRKTRSISATRRSGMSVQTRVLKRADFDRQGRRSRELAAPLERAVQIGSTDDGEASDVLLSLDVGA